MGKPAKKAAAGKTAPPWALANISGSHNWKAVAQSSDGTIVAAADNGGAIWVSKDFGTTWNATSSGSKAWCDLAMNADGSHMIAGFAGNGHPGSAGVAVSSSTGSSWGFPTLPYDPTAGMTGACSVAISGSGSIMACGDASFAELFLSSGGSWSAASPPPLGSVLKVVISGDGRLIAVSWMRAGGGVFVSGDEWGIVRTSRMNTATLDQTWTGQYLPWPQDTLLDENAGQFSSASYALVGADKPAGKKGTPTFVIGGQGFPYPPGEFNQAYAAIFVSQDGYSWSLAMTIPPSETNTQASNIVWDKAANGGAGAFFADIHTNFIPTGAQSSVTYTSVDGVSWTESGDDFVSHCNGQIPGKPDGFYGYDAGTGVLIQPNDEGLGSGFGVIVTNNSGKTQVDLFDALGSLVVINCVAFAGGIWEAAGSSGITPDAPEQTVITLSSTDNGQTWTQVTKGALGMHEEEGAASYFGAIVGGPNTDFP
jgi:hypothetical protein